VNLELKFLFLRSSEAASNTAMEHHILEDLYAKFIEYDIQIPGIVVWLRSTFVFRNLIHVQNCIDILRSDLSVSAVRAVVESENRLYGIENDILSPQFEDYGRSMVRRQDVGKSYKVFSTDFFRFSRETLNDRFLGANVRAVVTDKICGFDIDDFEMTNSAFSLHRGTL